MKATNGTYLSGEVSLTSVISYVGTEHSRGTTEAHAANWIERVAEGGDLLRLWVARSNGSDGRSCSFDVIRLDNVSFGAEHARKATEANAVNWVERIAVDGG